MGTAWGCCWHGSSGRGEVTLRGGVRAGSSTRKGPKGGGFIAVEPSKRVPQGKSEPDLPTYLRDNVRHFFFVPRLVERASILPPLRSDAVERARATAGAGLAIASHHTPAVRTGRALIQ